MISEANNRILNKFCYLTNLKKLGVLLVMLFSILGICYSQVTNPSAVQSTPPKKIDSAAIIIKKYKDDVVNFQKTIDTLTKQVKANNLVIPPSSKQIFIIGTIVIGAICILICLFLIYISYKSPQDIKFAFGLPDGTVRAIIAILAIIFYILVSIVFAILSASTIATDVTKTLGTLVVAVSAFYFGSKTAEQSTKAATDTLTSMLNKQSGNADDDVPVAVIQQAIATNKANWMQLYNCQNIILGKKKTQNTIHDLDCIVFIVNIKGAPSPDTSPIPPSIAYNSQGKIYNIPTDVQ